MKHLAFILLCGLSLQTLAQGPTPALRNPATQTPLPPPPPAVDAADNQLSPEQKQKISQLLSRCELMSFAPEDIAKQANSGKDILEDAEKVISILLSLIEEKA